MSWAVSGARAVGRDTCSSYVPDLETRLARTGRPHSVFADIAGRAAAAARERARKAEERRRRRAAWEDALPRARQAYIDDLNVTRLREQAAASAEARAIRGYCARLPDASARTRAAYRARSASSRRSRHSTGQVKLWWRLGEEARPRCASCRCSYQRATRAGLAGCIVITSLDLTMITGVLLAVPAVTWPTVAAMAAARHVSRSAPGHCSAAERELVRREDQYPNRGAEAARLIPPSSLEVRAGQAALPSIQ